MKMGGPPVHNRRPAKKTMTTGGNLPPSRVPTKRTGGNLPPSRTPGNTGVVPPHMRKASRALDRLSRKPKGR